jgi:hypothetical protein
MRKSGWICSVLFTFLLVLSFSFSGYSQTWTPKYVSMTSGTGGYFEYLPVGYGNPVNANKRYPVILFIQGVGDMGNGISELDLVRRNGLPAVIDAGQFPDVFTVNGEQFSFIAIVPQFSGWPNPTQIHNILNFIEANYRADASRLYMTGLSMGGGATWDYAGASLANAKRLAAILPVCGASNPNSLRIQNIANAKLPVLATHNDLDPTVPSSNTIGYVNGINGYNSNPPAVKLIWNGDYHNSWIRTYDPAEKLIGNLNAYEWMLQYSREVVTPVSPLTVSISASSMISCFGNSNGSSTAQASGGTLPYSFSWNTSPSQTSATASNLVAGNYTVTVRDANGVTATTSVTITQPALLSLTATAGTIPSNGGSTSVSLSATGGTFPYVFDGPTTNVRAGSYTYTVTDAKGCKATSTITITEPPVPQPTVAAELVSRKDVSCFGGTDGSAEIRATSGLAPFTYTWNTVPVQNSPAASQLKAGKYTVMVTDANNNSARLEVNITEPQPLKIDVVPGTINIFGGNTNVVLGATGGTAPYTFTGPVSGVRAGSYSYTVTDANGCSDVKSLTISEPAPAAVSLVIGSVQSVSCSNGSNGSATALVSGGTAPFVYTWSTIPVQSTQTAVGLKAGTYTVNVRDANGVSANETVTITQPSTLGLQITPGTIQNFGGTTSVSLSATGGTAPYVFTGPETGVKAGTYTYTVTDAKGCSDVKSVTITEPAPAAVSVNISSIRNVSCYNGADGSTTAMVSGGTAPFVYTWNTSPVQSGPAAIGLSAGSYSLTVSDANGQTATVSFVVSQPEPIQINVIPGSILSFGGTTTVELQAKGGTPPYAFSGALTANVTAGTYTYRVSDQNGCTKDTIISISQPAPRPVLTPLSLSVKAKDVNCFDGNDGTATVEVENGAAPYTYSWNTVPVQSTKTALGLKAGNYNVTVMDANGTSANATVTIAHPAALSLQITPGSIQNFGGTTSVSLSATGGTAPYAFIGETQRLTAGTYSYIVNDALGCSATGTVTLGQPQQLVLNASAAPIRCSGGTTNVILDIKGGAAPYQVVGNTTDLKAGTYAFTVSDAYGASASTSIEIKEPLPLALTALPGTIEINGGSTNITLLASGGVAPYVFNGNATNVVAGTHIYSVIDANGCSATTSLTLTQPDPLIIKATAGEIKCFGGTTNVSVNVQGGKAPYTYMGDTTGLRAGTHTFTVVDSKGSKASASVVLAEPEKLELIATPGLIRKIGGFTDVTLNAKGGIVPYTYLGTTSGIRAGDYQYEVTDAKNCRASATVEVREPAVKLTSFEVSKGDSAVSLKWGTSYEYAIDYFEIERSIDNYNFASIKKTTSLWSSMRLATYLVKDPRPALSRNNYRIVAVTMYGERIILEEKDLLYENKQKVVVRNMINQLDIIIEDQNIEDIQVMLYDLNGRPLKSSKYSKQYFTFNTKMSMDELPKGAYIISITSAHIRYTKQVIKL